MNRKRLTPEMVKQKAEGQSYADIGLANGLTRQRIQQIFSPPLSVQRLVADRARALCERCGQFDQFGHFHHKVYEFEILNTPENIEYLCIHCHHKEKGEGLICLGCGEEIDGSGKKFCSRICQIAYNSITHECSNCYTQFTMNSHQKIRVRKSKSGLIFCSKRCQGLYWAEHSGFTAHPENMRKNHQ